MSTDHSRNRGSLFENNEKRKPSQPDLRGDCTIAGTAYEMQAWKREDQLSLTLATARIGQNLKNTLPKEAFRGSLDPAPTGRGAAKGDGEKPVWIGNIAGDEASYSVRAFQKQGKSGPYLTLTFEPAEAVEQEASV